MPVWRHDGLDFHYRQAGEGNLFLFQHGLGGDVDQPFGLFAPPQGVRLVALDCRAHGKTPVGDESRISISSFADDLRSLLDHLGAAKAVVGGISLGAAVALNFALRHGDRLAGLVLSRPAWLSAPNAKNLEIYGSIARLLRQHGPAEGLMRFQQSHIYRHVLAESPDAARSLEGQFTHPRALEAVARLERLPPDSPCRDLAELRAIEVPTLVLANRQDPIHPFEYGRQLAEAIPRASFVELTPKSISVEEHRRELQRALEKYWRMKQQG